MPSPPDYYALLKVSPKADRATIQAAYRALMRRYHPDLNSSAEAAIEATNLNEAYACLRDPDQRAAYDRERAPRPSRPRPRAASTAAHAEPHRPTWTGPTWTGPAPRAEPSAPWFRPTWGKAIGLGTAGLITALTFTLTSMIPPVAPPAAKPALVISMRVVPHPAPAPTSPCPDRTANPPTRTPCAS